jgi:hypothetical protein
LIGSVAEVFGLDKKLLFLYYLIIYKLILALITMETIQVSSNLPKEEELVIPGGLEVIQELPPDAAGRERSRPYPLDALQGTAVEHVLSAAMELSEVLASDPDSDRERYLPSLCITIRARQTS